MVTTRAPSNDEDDGTPFFWESLPPGRAYRMTEDVLVGAPGWKKKMRAALAIVDHPRAGDIVAPKAPDGTPQFDNAFAAPPQ